jgi:hypothetical protein
MLAYKQLEHTIGATFSLQQTAEAHLAVKAGQTIGNRSGCQKVIKVNSLHWAYIPKFAMTISSKARLFTNSLPVGLGTSKDEATNTEIVTIEFVRPIARHIA